MNNSYHYYNYQFINQIRHFIVSDDYTVSDLNNYPTLNLAIATLDYYLNNPEHYNIEPVFYANLEIIIQSGLSYESKNKLKQIIQKLSCFKAQKFKYELEKLINSLCHYQPDLVCFFIDQIQNKKDYSFETDSPLALFLYQNFPEKLIEFVFIDNYYQKNDLFLVSQNEQYHILCHIIHFNPQSLAQLIDWGFNINAFKVDFSHYPDMEILPGYNILTDALVHEAFQTAQQIIDLGFDIHDPNMVALFYPILNDNTLDNNFYNQQFEFLFKNQIEPDCHWMMSEIEICNPIIQYIIPHIQNQKYLNLYLHCAIESYPELISTILEQPVDINAQVEKDLDNEEQIIKINNSFLGNESDKAAEIELVQNHNPMDSLSRLINHYYEQHGFYSTDPNQFENIAWQLIHNNIDLNVLNYSNYSNGETILEQMARDLPFEVSQDLFNYILKQTSNLIQKRSNHRFLRLDHFLYHTRQLQTMIDFGLNVDAVDSNQETPLFKAVQMDFVESAQVLLTNHCSINHINQQHNNALFYVQSQSMIDLLFDYHIDYDQYDKNNQTALQFIHNKNQTMTTQDQNYTNKKIALIHYLEQQILKQDNTNQGCKTTQSLL